MGVEADERGVWLIKMFFVFEGIDGSGKSTQAAYAADWLRSRLSRNDGSGRSPQKVLLTREPGGWDGGGTLRELALGGSLVSSWSEFFLFMADRCEHAERVLRPAIEDGQIVVCDRYTPSTTAYQLFGVLGGLGGEMDEAGRGYLLRLADEIGLPRPNAIFWLDLDVATARQRLESRGDCNAFDARDSGYFERVRAGYEEQMRMGVSGDDWIRIDASRSRTEISAEVACHLERLVTL